MCNKFNIPVVETPFNLKELMDADDIIVTSSGQFCMIACEIDKKPVGGKATGIVNRLQEALHNEFIEETSD